MRCPQLHVPCFILFATSFTCANGFAAQSRCRSSHSHCRASLLDDTTTYASESAESPVDEIHPESSSSRLQNVLHKLEEKMGTIDDSRVLFPEYESQQVSHLYSSLQYNNREDGKLQITRKVGNVWNAGALIAGTALGAGVLAFPAATAEIGFVPSAVALIPAWIYMTMSGLLLAELHLNRMAETGKVQHQLLDLVDLGTPWNTVATGSFFAVEYALVAYYLSQHNVVNPILLAGVLGSAVAGLSSGILQKMNAVLLASALLAFGVTTVTSGGISVSALVADQHPELVLSCLPILFMSLVYQSVVPTVVSNLEGDRTKITQAVIGGTTLPFLTMLTWNAFSLGGVSLDGPAATCFTSLALLTSLMSLTSSLATGWENLLSDNSQDDKEPTSVSSDDTWKRCTMVALALLPPLAFQQLSADSNNAFTALEYAGIFGASTLFLILTPIAAWNQRYRSDKPIVTKPMVPFGKIPLGSMWKAAATLIIEQGAEKLGVFEFIQHHLFASSI